MTLTRRALLQASALAIASTGIARASTSTNAPRSRDGIVHIGNSTHLVTLDGLRILTDPWVRDPADAVLLHRVPPAPIPTNVDVILITHEHEDHFDEIALATIDKRATIVVPKWLEQRTRALGFTDVVTCVAGDSLHDVRGLAIDVAEARHDVIEVNYRFARGGKAIFLGGDTLPTKSIQDLAARKPVDFAILPADGGELLGTRWVMNPAEARDLAFRFGVTNDAKKGALLTHHECVVAPPWGIIVHIDPPNPRNFPHWYRIPNPGDVIPFPWSNT